MSQPSRNLTRYEKEKIKSLYIHKTGFIETGITTQVNIAKLKHGETYKDKEHFKFVLNQEISEIYVEYWKLINITKENEDLESSENFLIRCIEEAMDCIAVIRKWREQNGK